MNVNLNIGGVRALMQEYAEVSDAARKKEIEKVVLQTLGRNVEMYAEFTQEEKESITLISKNSIGGSYLEEMEELQHMFPMFFPDITQIQALPQDQVSRQVGQVLFQGLKDAVIAKVDRLNDSIRGEFSARMQGFIERLNAYAAMIGQQNQAPQTLFNEESSNQLIELMNELEAFDKEVDGELLGNRENALHASIVRNEE
jgi:hypothetical protein